MKLRKRVLAFLLVLVMVISLMPATTMQKVQAEGFNIDLGDVSWNEDKSTYTFPNVTVSFTSDNQKIFCLSVDNGGSFVLPSTITLGTDCRLTGIAMDSNGDKEYVPNTTTDSITGGMELSSLTVIGSGITKAQIVNFIQSLTFNRNNVDKKTEQIVSVVANEVELADDETAMAIDGVIHYYKYVPFTDASLESIGTLTWYDAYSLAKDSEFEGMNGYLATITEDNEQIYIYGALGGGLRAWIGGARTTTDNIVFDADEIQENALNPGAASYRETDVRTFYWMCGPEAGEAFYETNVYGSSDGGHAINDAYNFWNKNPIEPNNQYSSVTSSVPDDYGAEYVLEYGFDDAGYWNDYSPYNTYRSNSFGILGYIIEYSPYTLSGDGVNNTSSEEETPSSTDSKVVAAISVTVEANDLILSTDDAKALTDADKAIDAADVTVEDEDGILIDDATVTVDASELDTINDGNTGVYDLTFSSGSDEDTVVVTVVDKTTAGEGTDGSDVVIGANDFCISEKQAAAIEDDLTDNVISDDVAYLMKVLANAVATDDGKLVSIDDINVTDITLSDDENSPSTVTFEYNGIEVTVNITVKDNGATDADNEDAVDVPSVNLTANDFEVEEGSSDLSADDFLSAADVVANKNDGTDVTPVVNADDLAALNEAIASGDVDTIDVRVTADGEETTVTVTITQKYPRIDANDFIIAIEDINGTDATDVVNLSDAEYLVAENASGDSSKVTVVDLTALKNQDEPGKVDLTLNSTVDDTTTTVTATVVDKTTAGEGTDGSDVVIGANNFSISEKQKEAIIADLTDDTISEDVADLVKALANAVATDDGEAVAVDDINVTDINISNNADTPSTATFEYQGKTVTVNITTKDNGATDEDSDNALDIPDTNITANDFEVWDDVGEISPDDFIGLSDATATDENGSSVSVTVDEEDLAELQDAIDKGIPGEYDVTVKAGDDETIVTVTVNKKYPRIEGNDFIISVEDAEDVTASEVVNDYADAKQYIDENNSIEEGTVGVVNIADLNNQNVPGEVDIILTGEINGTTATRVVVATVVDVTDYGTNADGDSIGLGANNFTVDETDNKTVADAIVNGDVSAVTDAIKEMADAVATNNGQSVDVDDITVASVTPLDAEAGTYNVTFTYEGQSVTVVATVILEDEPEVTIDADDFTVSTDDGPLDVNDILTNSNATATDDDGNDVSDLNVDVDDLDKLNDAINNGIAGDYTVEIYTKDDEGNVTATTTVTVTVTASEEKDKNVTLTAKDFTVTTGSDALTDADFVKKANVVAKDDTGSSVPVTVDPTDLATLNKAINDCKPGTYTVDVTAGDKTTTVTVTVTKPQDTTGDDQLFEISNAKDIPQDLDKGREVSSITVDGTVIPSDKYTVDGDTVTIDSSVFQNKKADTTSKVVITYKDGSKRTFNVKIVSYDKTTVVTKVPIFQMQKDLGVGKKFTINLVGMNKYAVKSFKSSNNKIATVNKNGVITGKKKGKCTITAKIIQKGSYYTVKIKLHVKKSMKMYNLRKKALQKQEGTLPEFNVYKRVVKGKKTKMKFTNVDKDAKITFTTSNKKIATVSKNGVIKGKKKGFCVITAKIEQRGHAYYTKLIVRVDDGTKNKQLKKYLK